MKGLALLVLLCTLVFISLYFLNATLRQESIALVIFSSLMVFYGLANRSLITEALKVEGKLGIDDIEAARNQLARIVGRDTSKLSADKIRRAVLETLSENLSDGVIAPMFFYAIGGIPLMFTYKMVNTLDSMIGYKTERFAQFGWSSAKLDDVLNFIPARLTAIMMSVITFSWRGLKFIFLFGNNHISLNAGYPEAALAGILNCRLGGPSSYQGTLIDKPYLGINNRMITPRDIYFSCSINVLVVIAFLIVILLFEN